MSIRVFIVLLIALAAAGLAWHQRTELQAWASAATQPAFSAPLRKCVKGQAVSYSNVECPPGHTEQAVTAAVTVLPATPVPRPADGPSSAPAALRKALDIEHRGESMTDKAIERAANGGR
jgi:hypothetical protein